MRATPRLEFSNFNIASMAPERVVIAPLNGGAADAEGRISVLRTRYDGAELRGVARLTLGADGGSLSSPSRCSAPDSPPA